MGIIPLSILGQQLCEWPGIFHPELLAHCILLEEAATQVEVEHGVEHVHPLVVGQIPQEVAVRVSSRVFGLPTFWRSAAKLSIVDLVGAPGILSS